MTKSIKESYFLLVLFDIYIFVLNSFYLLKIHWLSLCIYGSEEHFW
jgi:hypothetical protein